LFSTRHFTNIIVGIAIATGNSDKSFYIIKVLNRDGVATIVYYEKPGENQEINVCKPDTNLGVSYVSRRC